MAVSGNAIVSEVEKFAGYKYVYGGSTPAGFDCSGLVQYVLQTLGEKNVPRTSEAQYAWATPVSKANLKPGDLVFAQFPGDNASPGHVGIYTGNGQVLSAEDPASGVGYSSLASWGNAIVGYGQAPGTSTGTGGTVQGVQGNVPGVSAPGATPSGAVGTGNNPSGAATPTSSDLTSLIAPIRQLLHAVATVIDYSFTMFEPGQGLRAVFALLAVVMAFMSYKILAGAGVVPNVSIPMVVPV